MRLVHEGAVASLAQSVARRSHNPKVVSSILTGGSFFTLFPHRGRHLEIVAIDVRRGPMV